MTPPATDSFLPQPFPVVLLRVLGKPQQAFEGQSHSRCQSQLESHHICHTKFFQQWENMVRPAHPRRVMQTKETDRDSKTFLLPLLYPIPKRHRIFVLLLTYQLSASSREWRASEPGLCYAFVTCPTPWRPGPVQNWHRTGQISQMRCHELRSLLYPTDSLFPWTVLAENGLESQAMHFSRVTVPHNNAARFSSHSEIATDWLMREELLSEQHRKQLFW